MLPAQAVQMRDERGCIDPARGQPLQQQVRAEPVGMARKAGEEGAAQRLVGEAVGRHGA
jgi:hypothetical protein